MLGGSGRVAGDTAGEMQLDPEVGGHGQHPAERRRERKEAERLLRQLTRRHHRDDEERPLAREIGERPVGDEFRAPKRAFVRCKHVHRTEHLLSEPAAARRLSADSRAVGRHRGLPRNKRSAVSWLRMQHACLARGRTPSHVASFLETVVRRSHLQVSLAYGSGHHSRPPRPSARDARRPACAHRSPRDRPRWPRMSPCVRSCSLRRSSCTSPLVRVRWQSISNLETVIVVALAAWLAALAWSRQWPRWRTPLTAAWIALLAAMGAAAVFAPAARANALHMTGRMTVVFAVFLLAVNGVTTTARLHRVDGRRGHRRRARQRACHSRIPRVRRSSSNG